MPEISLKLKFGKKKRYFKKYDKLKKELSIDTMYGLFNTQLVKNILSSEIPSGQIYYKIKKVAVFVRHDFACSM